MQCTELIIFDSLAKAWTTDKNFNRAFLKHLFAYWNSCIAFKDYIYLNKIYEDLGLDWNPNETNICYRSRENIEFSFKEYEDLNKFEVIITHRLL